MTTAAQVRKLVKPLLARRPDLILVGRMIVVAPVRHVLRAVYIDRTGEAARFKPRWVVLHLFQVYRDISFNLGGEIYKPRSTTWHDDYPTLWWNDDPETPTVLAEAVENILTKLEPLGELEAYYRHLIADKDHAYHLRPHQRVIVETARGNLDEVRTICGDELSKWPDNRFGNRPDELDMIRLPKLLCTRLANGNVSGIAALLHEWEAITVKNLKIEHLWEPTPFPLETTA